MTSREAKAVATSAFIFLVPLVESYASMYRQAIDPSSLSYSGGFGHWLHHRTSTTSESKVTTAHATSVYSSAWVDLRSEPWALSIPTMEGGAAYAARVTDLWGFVLDRVTVGDDCGRVLLASPAWIGEMPAGVDRVARAESDFARTEVWVHMNRRGDLEDARSLQNDLELTPLSALAGVGPPVAAPPVEWWPVHGEVTSTDEFWSVANFALTLTTPHEQDRALLERIAEIGVVAGRRWKPSLFDDHVLEAIGEGIDDAITELMRASPTADVGELHRSRADTDRDYFGRALGALHHVPSRLVDAG